MSYFNLVSWFASSSTSHTESQTPESDIAIVKVIPIEETGWDTLDSELPKIKIQQMKKLYIEIKKKIKNKSTAPHQENEVDENMSTNIDLSSYKKISNNQLNFLLRHTVTDNEIEIFNLIKEELPEVFKKYVIRENLYQHTTNWNATSASLAHFSKWSFINFTASFGTPEFLELAHSSGFKFKEDSALYLLQQRCGINSTHNSTSKFKQLERKLKYFKSNGGHGLDNENWMSSTIFSPKNSKNKNDSNNICHLDNEKLLNSLINELSRVSNDRILVFLIKNHQSTLSITPIKTIFKMIQSKNMENVITINVLREIFKTSNPQIWDFFVSFIQNYVSHHHKHKIFETKEPINKIKSLANSIFSKKSTKKQEKLDFLLNINSNSAPFEIITPKLVTQAIKNDCFKIAFNMVNKYDIRMESSVMDILLSKQKNNDGSNDKLHSVLLNLYNKQHCNSN